MNLRSKWIIFCSRFITIILRQRKEQSKLVNAGRKCWDTYQNTSEQSPSPPSPPQAMLSFDDQTHIYTRKTIYLHLSTLYWGGVEADYAQIVPLKITIVVLNDSLVIFGQFSLVSQLLLTSIVVWNYFDLQCKIILTYNI